MKSRDEVGKGQRDPLNERDRRNEGGEGTKLGKQEETHRVHPSHTIVE